MGFNSIRWNGPPRVTPLLRRGKTTQRGTTQLEFSSWQTANVHLSTLKFSPAKNAEPLVVERIPAPGTIAYAQVREPIIEIYMSDHYATSSLLIASRHTIGAPADCVVGQNPTTRLLRRSRLTLQQHQIQTPAGITAFFGTTIMPSRMK